MEAKNIQQVGTVPIRPWGWKPSKASRFLKKLKVVMFYG